jgi:hypothetical protein
MYLTRFKHKKHEASNAELSKSGELAQLAINQIAGTFVFSR